MPFHVALLWALFWISGIGPALVMLYIPIRIAWIIGYGLYLGSRRTFFFVTKSGEPNG